MKRSLITALFCVWMPSVLAQTAPLGTDIRLFQGEVLPLARAVRHQRAGAIRRLAMRKPALLNYQEPIYGQSVLAWAVSLGKLRSVEQLLKSGANPNVIETYSGETPLIEAATNERTSAFVRVLLANGANPNMAAHITPQTRYPTPLIAAANSRLESVRLLSEAGAELTHKTPGGSSALLSALLNQKPDIVLFLLVEKKNSLWKSY